MISYYLDDQPVDAPEGVDGIRFVKRRHRTYFGFLYQRLGLVEGLGNLSFLDPEAVQLLRRAYAKAGILAEVSFQVRQDGIDVLYDGYINFEAYSYQYAGGTESVSVMLRDDKTVVDLEARAATEFALPATTPVLLHARHLAGSAALELDTARAAVTVKRKDLAPLLHSLPLKNPGSNDKSNLPGRLADASEPLATSSCYTNTTAQPQTLRVTGTVSLTGRAEQNTAGNLELLSGDTRITVARLAITTTAQKQLTLLDQTIIVAAGAELRVLMRSDDEVTGYQIIYDALSVVQLDVSDRAADSITAGLLAGDLLAGLVARCSPGLLLRSDFFGEGLAARLLLTSGAMLRGVGLPIRTSLATAFQNLSALFSLSMGFDQDGQLRIEDRASLKQRRRTSYVREIFSYAERPCAERLYSEVTAGYASWQGGSADAALDVNTSRQYLSPLTRVRNTLSLQCGWIASGAMIEEQRRKQYDTETASAGRADGQDNALYLIVTRLLVTPGRAGIRENERLEYVADLAGVTDAGNAYNLAISPRRMVQNWASQLSPCLPLTLEESATRQSVRITYNGVAVDESAGLPGSRTIPLEVTVETPMPLTDFYRLGDWIVLPDDTEGLLMDASWQRTAAGDVATLTIWPDWTA